MENVLPDYICEPIEISAVDVPAMAIRDGRLTLAYESLRSTANSTSGKRLNIALAVHISPDDDRLTWSAQIDNREAALRSAKCGFRGSTALRYGFRLRKRRSLLAGRVPAAPAESIWQGLAGGVPGTYHGTVVCFGQ